MKVLYPIITDINELIPLTTLGICKLMAFDEMIVARSFKVLKESNKIRKPWSFLMKLCMQFSQEQSKQLDWDTVGMMCKALKIDENGDEIEFEGYRNRVSESSSIKGKIERPKQFDTSYLMRDFSKEDSYTAACEFYDNILVDTYDEKNDFIVTSYAKRKVTGGINPHWNRLTKEQQQTLNELYPQFKDVKQSNRNFIEVLQQQDELRLLNSSC